MMTDQIRAVPLTEAQSGLWYSQRLDPTNPIFNTGQYLDLKGPLDFEAFRYAVDQASREAEALALRFAETSDGPVQFVDPSQTPTLSFIDLSAKNEEEAEAEALSLIAADMARAVVPEQGALAGQVLYRLAPERHFWAQRVHHLANDGYGMVLLTTRVAELYKGALTGAEGAGRAFASLAAVWAEDAAYRADPARADDAAWWRRALDGMDEIVGMAQGRAISAHGFHRFEDRLNGEVLSALDGCARKAGVNWPDALTALVAAYCRRFTATDEIVVGVPHMGRFGSASARVPAMVMNVLPLRIRPDEAAPLDQFLADAAADTAAARKHGRYRSEQLRRDLGLIGGNRRLYGPLINVQPYDRPPRFAGLEVVLHVTGTGPVEDINFTFRGDLKSGLTIEVDSNPSLYSAEETSAHGRRLAVFLEAAVSAARLAEVPTATPDEAVRELEAFNQTEHPLADTTLTALIEEAIVRHGTAPAVRFDGQPLSYSELGARSEALAAQLQAMGAGAGRVVAVALPRSIELVVALVAVLRAGASYLPLDMTHPPARLATILKSAEPVTVLAHDDLHGLFGALLLSPASWDEGSAADVHRLACRAVEPSPDDPAYVIYTSGSTGEPKGVVVGHRAIVNRLIWMQTHYDMTKEDRILQKTPATFDVSVWEFFLGFLSGAVLVVAPPDAHRDPVALAKIIRDEQITTLHFVPSMLSAFLDAPQTKGLCLKRVFCSGEELPADLRDRFHRLIDSELHNLYGPTEAAVDVSYWPAGPDDASRPVPIGFPVWNTRLVLLDEHLRPVAPAMAGHLYLGGVQLAEGYLGRADLTAERFIDDPYHPGQRLYMTGDLARRRDDGAIVFLGRADHQLKIRGLRIELGEIEAAIAASGLTRSANVIARENRLVAYVVPDDGFSVNTLRAHLAARLPEYMVPAAVVELDHLPVTSNGKLDRKALPAPRFETAGGASPATDTEKRLAVLFQELLGLSGPISAEDDFFALGGDSLGAVRLMMRVEDEWGADPGLAALFEVPDVRGLAARIDEAMAQGGGDDGLGPVVTLSRGRGDDAADTDRAPLFVVHPAGGICWGYRALATALSPSRPVYGLQAPALNPDLPVAESIEALAADYAQRMIGLHPEGPYHVAGWSVGGIIAQAIAVELKRYGHRPGLVAMLDSYPAECWRAEAEPTEEQALRALLAIAGYDPEQYPHLKSRAEITDFLRAGDSALGNLPPRTLDGVVRTVLDTNRLIRGHYHKRYDGVLTHVRAGLDHVDKPQLQPVLWADYAAQLDLVSVPFLHAQLTGPGASAMIAPILSERMMQSGLVPA